MIRSEFIKFTFLICILSSFLSLSVAVAQHDIEVLSVLAPGSGSNYVVQEKSPAGIDSQIGMYDSLPKNLSTLDESTLIDFFKPAMFFLYTRRGLDVVVLSNHDEQAVLVFTAIDSLIRVN